MSSFYVVNFINLMIVDTLHYINQWWHFEWYCYRKLMIKKALKPNSHILLWKPIDVTLGKITDSWKTILFTTGINKLQKSVFYKYIHVFQEGWLVVIIIGYTNPFKWRALSNYIEQCPISKVKYWNFFFNNILLKKHIWKSKANLVVNLLTHRPSLIKI